MDLMDKMTFPVYDALQKKGRHKLAEMYRQCFKSTWDTTLQRDNGTVFLITGDIPAMWLRDSSAQVYHYLPFARAYKEVEDAVEGLIRRQMQYITLDPYANAFNREPNGNKYERDDTSWTPEQEAWTWERKYEIDSLCYPIRLAHAFWRAAGNTAWRNDTFISAARNILEVWGREQRHFEGSPYYFNRTHCPPSDTLPCGGHGSPVGYTGMTWSGFRPSDDACRYGYLIPSNFFALRALTLLTELLSDMGGQDDLIQKAQALSHDIREGLNAFSVVEHPQYGPIYAYEVDGLGHANLMDDANVPSLLSLPYLGCLPASDPVYQNTRRFLLSPDNPYYYSGAAARGIGSPHTPAGYVWPISLCIQGLTTDDPDEIRGLIHTLETTDAGTGLMHEGVDVNDPARFTRPWFAWANSIFSEFVEKAEPCL